MAQPMLEGYRALDLTDEKGFLCGKILADLGVDVIKVERPGGDPARRLGPFYHDIPDPGKSLLWFAYNAGKRGITLNIETADGQEIFRRLVEKADFVIESFPPGYLDNLGLGYDDLNRINPRIIMTSITPFGQTGPYKDYKVSDLICMAMGGLMYICGDPDRPPVRFSVEQAYAHGATQATAGTLIAHYHRERTGEGQHVDVSIVESIIWTLCYSIPYWDLNKVILPRTGNRQKRAKYSVRFFFPCKDGYVAYRIGTGNLFGPWQIRLVEAMNKEGLGEDLKDVDWMGIDIDGIPQQDLDRWEKIVGEYFQRHTKAELHEMALERNINLFPVNNMGDILRYQQLHDRDYWIELEHPELGVSLTYPGAFFKSTEVSCETRCRAPLIGEHNLEVYEKEPGLNRKELVCLKEAGVI